MGPLIPSHITIEVIFKGVPVHDSKLDVIEIAVNTIKEIVTMVASEVQALKDKADALKASADRAEAKLQELKDLVAQLQVTENLSADTKEVLAQIGDVLTSESGELDAGSA